MNILSARNALPLRVALALLLALLTAGLAQAAPGQGSALPWDTPIERISGAITGPVAFMFALGGMVVLGVRWIFGGEMGGMTRGLLTTVVGICLLVLATRFVQVLFGVTGALVAA